MARRGKFGKAALLMGAAAVAAGVLLKRDKVTALLGQGQETSTEPSWTPAPAPTPANYDAPGPPANTATPAAAAEAANIGGAVSDYADIQNPDLSADEADRPLVEAGEGSAEGQEQAEAALIDAAATDAEGSSDYERQIEDAIEEAAQPFAGERTEGLVSEPEPEAVAPQPVPEP